MPINSSSTSYEVGAFYRQHLPQRRICRGFHYAWITWKTGIYFYGANQQFEPNEWSMAALISPWDVMPHGSISGNTISSPTMFVGYGSDWRNYCLLAALVANENTGPQFYSEDGLDQWRAFWLE